MRRRSPCEGQLRLVQCPQCDGWFLAAAEDEGEACERCYERYTPPRGGDRA